MEKLDIRYAAGIIDGEGHVTIVKDSWDRKAYNPKYMVLIKVGMCNEEIPRLLCNTFGGTYRPRKRRQINPKWADAWNWELRGPRAYEALRRMQPYLRVKKEHAKLCVTLHERIVAAKQERRAFHRHSPSEMAERDALWQQLKNLTYRGPVEKRAID